ncbi:hypothetical protein F2Q69_00047341 [Brassica cretica]|uniref:Uncharacterized protein n=1 Tax=Brassica cretica TaxID=69181 RepID=A0A8S9PQ05_BRACR|nr:hypothetical protein F2Q69_00047341 [Brassica cretica]
MSTDTTQPSTNTSHRSWIDTSQRTLVDTNPRVDMVRTLVLIHDENEDLHDLEGHMRNASGQRLDDQGAVIPDPEAFNLQAVDADNTSSTLNNKPLGFRFLGISIDALGQALMHILNMLTKVAR